jgi:hypothetical protein
MKSLLATIFFLASFFTYAESKVTLFVDLTPAGSFQAVSKKPKGNLIKQGSTFTADKLSVSIESFKTGIDLRDEHLWKHLNSSKHKKAILTDLKAQNGKGSGTLEVNGVKKPINIVYAEKGNEVTAKFKVKASSFGLPKAQYLGVGVNDDITVETNLPFKTR